MSIRAFGMGPAARAAPNPGDRPVRPGAPSPQAARDEAPATRAAVHRAIDGFLSPAHLTPLLIAALDARRTREPGRSLRSEREMAVRARSRGTGGSRSPDSRRDQECLGSPKRDAGWGWTGRTRLSTRARSRTGDRGRARGRAEPLLRRSAFRRVAEGVPPVYRRMIGTAIG